MKLVIFTISMLINLPLFALDYTALSHCKVMDSAVKEIVIYKSLSLDDSDLEPGLIRITEKRSNAEKIITAEVNLTDEVTPIMKLSVKAPYRLSETLEISIDHYKAKRRNGLV